MEMVAFRLLNEQGWGAQVSKPKKEKIGVTPQFLQPFGVSILEKGGNLNQCLDSHALNFKEPFIM